MNKVLSLFTLLFVSLTCLSTEQIPDLLIIEKDTFFLKSFPLEKLQFQKPPFSYGEFNFPHTGCWRGYVATWKVIDDKLALIEIEKVDSTKQKLNIFDFFKQNNFSPKLIDGYVYADWYSLSLITNSFPYGHRYSGIYLDEEYSWNENKKEVQLVFEKGVVKENNIKNFNSYKIGDTLCYDFSHFPPGLIKKKSLHLQASIIELRKDMALVKIYSYDTGKKKEIEQIRKYLGNMVNTDTLLTNPRYWEKE